MIRFVVADAVGVVLYQASTVLAWTDVLVHWHLPAGQQAVQVADWLAEPAHWRVVDGALVERATMEPAVSATAIAADNVAEAVISGLPDPCTVRVAGPVPAGPLLVAGGTLTLTASQAGAYRVRVTADPTHAPWEVTIDAA